MRQNRSGHLNANWLPQAGTCQPGRTLRPVNIVLHEQLPKYIRPHNRHNIGGAVRNHGFVLSRRLEGPHTRPVCLHQHCIHAGTHQLGHYVRRDTKRLAGCRIDGTGNQHMGVAAQLSCDRSWQMRRVCECNVMRRKHSLVCKNARGGGRDYPPAAGHNLGCKPKHQAGLATTAHKRDHRLWLQAQRGAHIHLRHPRDDITINFTGLRCMLR